MPPRQGFNHGAAVTAGGKKVKAKHTRRALTLRAKQAAKFKAKFARGALERGKGLNARARG